MATSNKAIAAFTADEEEQLFQRLLPEIQEFWKIAMERGTSKGVDDAKNMSYADFKAIARADHTCWEGSSIHPSDALPEEIWDKWIMEDPFVEKELQNDYGACQCFLIAWMESVTEIWAQIQEGL